MEYKEPTKKELEGMLYAALNDYESIYLGLRSSSFRGFLEGELMEIYDFLKSPKIRKTSAVRPACPVTSQRKRMGGGSKWEYKKSIAHYIAEKSGIDIQFPDRVTVNAFEAIANYLDSLE